MLSGFALGRAPFIIVFEPKPSLDSLYSLTFAAGVSRRSLIACASTFFTNESTAVG